MDSDLLPPSLLQYSHILLRQSLSLIHPRHHHTTSCASPSTTTMSSATTPSPPPTTAPLVLVRIHTLVIPASLPSSAVREPSSARTSGSLLPALALAHAELASPRIRGRPGISYVQTVQPRRRLRALQPLPPLPAIRSQVSGSAASTQHPYLPSSMKVRVALAHMRRRRRGCPDRQPEGRDPPTSNIHTPYPHAAALLLSLPEAEAITSLRPRYGLATAALGKGGGGSG